MHHLRRQSRNVFWIIVALQLATSFGAIALLTRMGPAIARVAQENVESVTAVEGMMFALADPKTPDAEARRIFFAALEAADRNVTEPEETPLLRKIRGSAADALAGDAEARARVLEGLRQLAEVNRLALRRADVEAQRLAEAGAWAAVVLAVVAFVFVRFVANRVDRRFVMPILEISSTLGEARQGDRFRRCSGGSDSPEIQNISEGVNRLLDESRERV